jgi:hypothetical protein
MLRVFTGLSEAEYANEVADTGKKAGHKPKQKSLKHPP